MIEPALIPLTPAILAKIKPENIIYADTTTQGGMGDGGSIILYFQNPETKEMSVHQVHEDTECEMYEQIAQLLFKHVDNDHFNQEGGIRYFDYFYGGMGTNAFINKNASFEVHLQGKFFIYKVSGIDYQIYTSVWAIFDEIKSILIDKPTRHTII